MRLARFLSNSASPQAGGGGASLAPRLFKRARAGRRGGARRGRGHYISRRRSTPAAAIHAPDRAVPPSA